MKRKKRGVQGIAPWTTMAQTWYHTTRPNALVENTPVEIINIFE